MIPVLSRKVWLTGPTLKYLNPQEKGSLEDFLDTEHLQAANSSDQNLS